MREMKTGKFVEPTRSEKGIEKEKKWSYGIGAVLIATSLIYSLGLFLMNTFLPWNEIAYKEYGGRSLCDIKLQLLLLLEHVANAGALIYLIAGLVIVWKLYLKCAIPNVAVILKKGLITIAIVFAVTVPFSFSDFSLIVDYIFPSQGAVDSVSILVVVSLFLRCSMTKNRN